MINLTERDLNYFSLERTFDKQLITPYVSLFGKALAQNMMYFPGASIEAYAAPF